MKGLLCFCFCLALIACDGNYREVMINGQVRDSLTGNFIVGSKIMITCWVYDTEIWESRKVIKDTLTDENGKFSFHFKKGEAIRMEVTHPNYKALKYAKTLDRSVNKVEFKLNKSDGAEVIADP